MQGDALEIDSLSKSVLPPRARSPERKLLPPRQRAHPHGGFALASSLPALEKVACACLKIAARFLFVNPPNPLTEGKDCPSVNGFA